MVASSLSTRFSSLTLQRAIKLKLHEVTKHFVISFRFSNISAADDSLVIYRPSWSRLAPSLPLQATGPLHLHMAEQTSNIFSVRSTLKVVALVTLVVARQFYFFHTLKKTFSWSSAKRYNFRGRPGSRTLFQYLEVTKVEKHHRSPLTISGNLLQKFLTLVSRYANKWKTELEYTCVACYTQFNYKLSSFYFFGTVFFFNFFLPPFKHVEGQTSLHMFYFTYSFTFPNLF